MRKQLKNQLQRIIRECNLLPLVIATVGLSKEMKETVLSSISTRTKQDFFEAYQMIPNIVLSYVIDSQSYLLGIIKQLRNDEDI